MSTIRDYATSNYYESKYSDSDWNSKAKQNANSFLSGLSINTDSGSGNGAISLSDYNMIRSGTYGKLMKAYYNKKEAEKAAPTQESRQAMMLMRAVPPVSMVPLLLTPVSLRKVRTVA